MAINFYLAAKYGKAPLWPEAIQDRALANQWSYWAMLEVEPSLVTHAAKPHVAPPEKRSEQAAAEAVEKLKGAAHSHRAASGQSRISGGQGFHDRRPQCGSVWNIGTMVGCDFSSAPKTMAWLTKCASRPANERAAQQK